MKFAPLRKPPLTVRAPDGSVATSPFQTGEEAPLCAWDECDRKAREEHHIIEPDASIAGPDGSQGANVWFFFCTAMHRSLQKSSHITYKSVKKSPYL